MSDMPDSEVRTADEIGVAISFDPLCAIGEGIVAPRREVAIIAIIPAGAPSRFDTGHILPLRHVDSGRWQQRSVFLPACRHAGRRVFVSLQEAREVQ